MADTKISELPAASAPDGTELLPVVQDGETRSVVASPMLNPVVKVSDYASLQEAVTAAAAARTASIGQAAVVQLLADDYTVSSAITGLVDGLIFQGAGKDTTTITYSGTGVLFDLGSFTTAPSNYWEGSTSRVTFRDLTIRKSTAGTEGSRTGTAIRDNGCGDVALENVRVGTGFAYGFCGSYGSDFSRFLGCDFRGCDVGMYLGPGSQQVFMAATQFYGNREGLVCEGASQGWIGGACSFIDSAVADISFLASTTTRLGLTSVGADRSALGWVIDGPWHESNAAGTGRCPPQHVLLDGPSTSYPQYLRVSRAYVVSGGTPSATDSYLRINAGTRVVLEGVTVKGDHIKYAVDIESGLFPSVYASDVRQVDGYTGLVVYNGGAVSDTWYEDRVTADGRKARSAAARVNRVSIVGEAGYRWNQLGDGTQQYGNGTDAPDVTWSRSAVGTLQSSGAVSAAGLTGATQASRYVGATGSGAPVTGTFSARDFVVDGNGVVWVCTTGGSPGTWTSSGVAASVSNTPAGGIAATNVQAAINELDTEKAALASPVFTGSVSIGTNPSASGILRWPYANTLRSRNQGNSGNVDVVQVDTIDSIQNTVQFGGTGANKVVTLAGGSTDVAGLGGTVHDHQADNGNNTTSETDIYTDTLAASILNRNGDKVSAVYAGTFANTAATKQLKVYFGGTVVFDSGALTVTGAGSWHLSVICKRVSSSVVRCAVSLTTTGVTTGVSGYTEVTGLTLTNTQVLKVTGQAGAGGANNDIVGKIGDVSWFAAGA